MGLSNLIIILLGIFNILDGLHAQNCDYSSVMEYGKVYYIFNKEYPNGYYPGTNCRWQATAPTDAKIYLTCDDINIPFNNQCYYDRLAVSLIGGPDFTYADRYCGQTTMNTRSAANKISVALFSFPQSPTGRFNCAIKAVKSKNCNCGWRQTRRIVGGTETGVNEYPSMVAIFNLSFRELYCGGNIISKRFVLTAAHCITPNNNASNIGLVVGDHNIKSGADTSAATLYLVERIIMHEKFIPGDKKMHNDIALLRTQTDIKFNLNIGPICLPFKYAMSNFDNSKITIMGWGTIEFSGPRSDVLLSADLKGVSNAYCSLQHPTGDIQSSQLCLYEEGKDGCQSDSGGPCLFYNANEGRLYLVGLISYGLGCGTEKPNVNTRVTSYLDWIVNNTPDAEYCDF